MKQLFFTLFIIPSLCFGQFGVKQNAPSASLHIGIDQNLIPIKTEGIEHKTLENTDSFLVIGEDGTVKTTPTESASTIKNLKYVFRDNVFLGDGKTSITVGSVTTVPKKVVSLALKNIADPFTTNDAGYILLPDTGSFAIALRFYGVVENRTIITAEKFYFGEVTLKVTNALSKKVLDEVKMSWLISNEQNRMSYNVVSEIHGEKGTAIKLELIRNSGFEIGSYSEKWAIFSPKTDSQISNGVSTVVMWKIK